MVPRTRSRERSEGAHGNGQSILSRTGTIDELRDHQARCPQVAIFVVFTRCSGTQALYPRGATIKANITTFCASASRWTHHKHRTPSSKATVTSLWPSNVLRAVVVLLWAKTTHRAAECVALKPTQSAAEDGRCLYCKPRGEGEVFFLKREEVWGSTFSIWRCVLGNEISGQTNPGQLPVCARFAHSGPDRCLPEVMTIDGLCLV